MTTSEKVQEICDRIVGDFHPDKIIMFGSHAYGTPGPFSDLDLLVVMPFEGSPLQQAARIIGRVNPEMGIDLGLDSAHLKPGSPLNTLASMPV